ncbi:MULTISPECIES: phage tail tube protein [unclassified Crossiella]|uniref:phage tail tube protein n=1 Tax=unclassified Crossiella TaxID=2620835 RepID=UPI001FFF2674|nr:MULTISPECIES: phage tail tube protein [unclassified Crossiella]MCK2242145.1 phage tail tube protein [Crossiella sp. S99.2]MCK2256048.1 phage tail tube protein [Crossiella sp. S99.1]
MGIGSGLGSSLGARAESTYGTYLAPNLRWYECNSVKLGKTKNVVMSKALATRTVSPASRRAVTTRGGGGSFEMEVSRKGGLGLLLNTLIGGTVTPAQQAATAAYLQTHPLGATTDPFGKSLTLQLGTPDAGGTSRPYTHLGAKLTAAEFSCGIDEYLMASFEVDSRDVTEAETLVAPSYLAATKAWHFGLGTIKVGATVGAAAAVDGVRKMALKFDRKMDVERQYFGGGGLKDEPILNDFTEITGTMEADYITKADFADRFRDDTQFSLIWEFVGDVIETSYSETLRFTLPAVFLDDQSPSPDGPGLVKMPLKFTVLNDGTNAPATVEIISVDTAL